jgi:hypothetical protein
VLKVCPNRRPKGGKVRRIRIKDALGSALVIFAATPPVFAVAQPNDVVRDITGPAAGVSTTAGTLAPAEIVTEVRRAGFEPISRPVQHGRVYVLLALDPYGMDVKLTVDADSGRVLWATGIIGARYGGAAYYSYRPLSRYERPPIPPADIPNMGPGKINSGSVRSSASTRSSPPLPRTRPADLTSAVAKETAASVPYPPPRVGEGREGGEPKAAAAGRSDVAPAANPPPVPPTTMVPVAPLE